MDDLIYTLKQQIIEALNLEDMKPEDIDENAALFGEGLGLDLRQRGGQRQHGLM